MPDTDNGSVPTTPPTDDPHHANNHDPQTLFPSVAHKPMAVSLYLKYCCAQCTLFLFIARATSAVSLFVSEGVRVLGHLLLSQQTDAGHNSSPRSVQVFGVGHSTPQASKVGPK